MTPNSHPAKTNPLLRALLGLLLLLPACGLCVSNLFLLTTNTFLGSFRSSTLQSAGDFVGLLNYEKLFTDQKYLSSFGTTFLLVFIHGLIAAFLPPLLAIAVNALGKKLQFRLRMLFTLPLAFFGPALIMLGPAFARGMWDMGSPGGTYLLLDGAAILAVTSALGLLVYSMVLRGQKESEQGGKLFSAPFIVTWLITQLATMAFTLQSFSVFSNMLPARDSVSLGSAVFLTMRNAQSGLTFSLSYLVFLLVALLGIVATVIIILGRVQLKHEPDIEPAVQPTRSGLTIPGWIVIVLGGIAALMVTLVPMILGVVKMLTSPSGSSNIELSTLFQVWVNSILPPLLVILFIQLPVAYLGALGIGAVQPFGKASQWLLLLFSPWLFVTSLPVAFAAFMNLRKADLVDSFIALAPPILISVPMLFIFTLFFRGVESKWREARASGMSMLNATMKHLIVPSLPIVVLMVTFSLIAATQDLIVPYLNGMSLDQSTATTMILRLYGTGVSAPTTSIITLFGFPVFLGFLSILVILQIFYLDRLTLSREPASADVKVANS